MCYASLRLWGVACFLSRSACINILGFPDRGAGDPPVGETIDTPRDRSGAAVCRGFLPDPELSTFMSSVFTLTAASGLPAGVIAVSTVNGDPVPSSLTAFRADLVAGVPQEPGIARAPTGSNSSSEFHTSSDYATEDWVATF
jgi:hypothetical protein